MKIAITRIEETYAQRMKDHSGRLSYSFLTFSRNLFKEIGEKTDIQGCSCSIGVTRKDILDLSTYEVFEVPEFIGYLVLEYQRELKEILISQSDTSLRHPINSI